MMAIRATCHARFTRASFYLHRHVDYDGKGLWNEAILEDDDEVN
jgi:hypothetical protein